MTISRAVKYTNYEKNTECLSICSKENYLFPLFGTNFEIKFLYIFHFSTEIISKIRLNEILSFDQKEEFQVSPSAIRQNRANHIYTDTQTTYLNLNLYG